MLNRRFGPPAAAISSLLLLAACGGGDNDEASQSEGQDEDSEVTFDPTLSVRQQNNITIIYSANLGGENLGADLPEGDWEWESLTLEVGDEQFDLLDENLDERDGESTTNDEIEPGVSPGEYEATITGVDPNGESHSNSTEYVVEADTDTPDLDLMTYHNEEEKIEEIGEEHENGSGYYDEDIPVHIELDTINPTIEGEVTLFDEEDNELGSAPVDDDNVARITISANTTDPDETRGPFIAEYSGDDWNEPASGNISLHIYGGEDDFGEEYRQDGNDEEDGA